MFQPKATKSQLPDSGDYTVHWCHQQPYQPKVYGDNVNIFSSDPGETHFAIRYSTRTPTGVINRLFLKVDLGQAATNPNGVSLIYLTLHNFLNQHRTLLEQADLVIIERQLPINYNMVRLSQAILSYFMEILRDKPSLPLIVEISSTLKTRLLDAPKGLNESQRKKWSETFGIVMLICQKDWTSLEYIDHIAVQVGKFSKINDLTDAVLMEEVAARWINHRYIVPKHSLEQFRGWMITVERTSKKTRGCWIIIPNQLAMQIFDGNNNVFSSISLDKMTGKYVLASGQEIIPDKIRLKDYIINNRVVPVSQGMVIPGVTLSLNMIKPPVSTTPVGPSGSAGSQGLQIKLPGLIGLIK